MIVIHRLHRLLAGICGICESSLERGSPTRLCSRPALSKQRAGPPRSRQQRILPMINSKKTSELIETSVIYLLSAAVAVGAFVLVWLISFVLNFGRA
jgi:hypothetical protein